MKGNPTQLLSVSILGTRILAKGHSTIISTPLLLLERYTKLFSAAFTSPKKYQGKLVAASVMAL